MPDNKPPAFLLYPGDFLSSSKVACMSAEEIGCYFLLLLYEWQDGFIPADVAKLSRLCRTTPDRMAEVWRGTLSECFIESESGRLVNQRLESERQKLAERRAERSESGRKGATAKWRNGSDAPEPKLSYGSAIDQPLANDGISSSSSISKEIKKRTSAPSDFAVSDEMRSWAKENGITADLDEQTKQFLDHHAARGQTFFDWKRAWQTWMRNAKAFARSQHWRDSRFISTELPNRRIHRPEPKLDHGADSKHFVTELPKRREG